jgi:hypothetical protein
MKVMMRNFLIRSSGCCMLGLTLLATGCQKAAPPTPQTSSTQAHSPQPTSALPSTNASVATEATLVPSGPEAASTNAASQRSITAKGDWYVPTPSNIGPPKPPSLTTSLKISGGNEQQFLCLGNLRIDEAFANDQWLRIDVGEFFTQIKMKELRPIERDKDFRTGKPLDLTASFSFLYPGKPIEKVSRLKGHFDVVTADHVQQYSNIRVAELKKLADSDPTLKSVGLTVTTEKEDYSDNLKYVVSVGVAGILTDLKLKDKDGLNDYKMAGHDLYLPAGGSRHEGSFSIEEANQYTIGFSVHTGLKRDVVPFDLTDIPVQPLKTLPPEDLAQSVVFVSSETNSELPKGLRMDAQIVWARASSNFGGKRSIVAVVELSGPVARDISRLESTTVTRATVPQAELLWDAGSILMPVQEEEVRPFVTSKQGRPVADFLRFYSPEPPVQMCQELSGEMTVLFVEESKTIVFTDFHNSTEGVIQDPDLERLGIDVSYVIEKNDDDRVTFKIAVETKDWSRIGGVNVISANGKRLMLNQQYRHGDQGTYGCYPKNNEFSGARVEIVINTKSRTEQYPFRFLNIPIPPAPK